MGSDWQEHRLSDVIELIGGGTPKRSHADYWGGGIPWLSVKDFNNGHRHVFTTEKTISEKGLNNSSTKMLQAGELIISARGTVGALAQLAVPMAFNQSCYGIAARTEYTHNDFLFYLLRFTVENLQRITHGAVFDTITRETFNHVTVSVPPLPDQHAIAHILGSLDDKIELNRQMNRTLEKMAQAIFKSWFVDFDPVRAKAEGRDTGLPKEIADLFPDSFEDSEIGKIPTGWEVKPIGDAVQCVGGATPSTKKAEFWDGGTNPFLTPKDMSSLIAPVILDTDRHITDAGVERISSKRLPAGTVILSSRAPIGYLAINEVSVSVNQGIIAMICNGDLPNHYVLLWTMASMETIKGKAGGTTFAEISKKNFRPIPALIPASSVLDAFTKQVEPLFQQVVDNVVSAESLARTRDTLLPKLISGELPIPDVEKILEGVE